MINFQTKTDKVNAKKVGKFYIITAVTPIITLNLCKPILLNPEFIQQGVSIQIVLSTIFELTLAFVAGQQSLCFPPFAKIQ